MEYHAQTISSTDMDARLQEMLLKARTVLREATKAGKDTGDILKEIDRIMRQMDAN